MFIDENTKYLKYEVEESQVGMSVIDVLARDMQVSSRLIRKSKSNKKILLNGKKKSVNTLLTKGDIINVMMDLESNTFEADEMNIDIVFENEDMLVINKEPFLVVHPTRGHPYGTLANGISNHLIKNKEDYKIRFINRLDRDTSGLILIAKNPYAQKIISDQMIANKVDKYYIAVVDGRLETKSATIDMPIGRESEDDIKRVVIDSGDRAITHYEVLKENDKMSLIKVKLETGRTHQIRVHLAHIGHPIVGDSLYGRESLVVERQALHCFKMKFDLPRNKGPIELEGKLPKDIESLIGEFK